MSETRRADRAVDAAIQARRNARKTAADRYGTRDPDIQRVYPSTVEPSHGGVSARVRRMITLAERDGNIVLNRKDLARLDRLTK